MFIKNDGGFWRNQEQANQFVHMWFGLFIATILWNYGLGYWSLLGGLIGLLEMARQIIFDNPTIDKDFFKDKFRDNCFYILGSLTSLIYVYFPIGV